MEQKRLSGFRTTYTGVCKGYGTAMGPLMSPSVSSVNEVRRIGFLK